MESGEFGVDRGRHLEWKIGLGWGGGIRFLGRHRSVLY
jgi:hypothetical protein